MNKALLILDLDETLVHARETPLDRSADATLHPYFLYLRPGVQDFLAQVAQHYQLAVWTSSSPMYARWVTEVLFDEPGQLAFVWASNRCTMRRNVELDCWYGAKHLYKVRRQGHDLDRVLMVDDSPEKLARNYGNLLRVRPYEGDLADDELPALAQYLTGLSGEPNLRRIEKRGWRKTLVQATPPRPRGETKVRGDRP